MMGGARRGQIAGVQCHTGQLLSAIPHLLFRGDKDQLHSPTATPPPAASPMPPSPLPSLARRASHVAGPRTDECKAFTVHTFSSLGVTY
jgi:hypothetical protein